MRGRTRWLGAVACAGLLVAGVGPAEAAPAGEHGAQSALSAGRPAEPRCVHRVPRSACTRCNPRLVERFKRAGDWCGEHGVPESQCFQCHPELSFDPSPLPGGADVRWLSRAGEDVPELAPHAAPGKVTIFDFYADWCGPCRRIDERVGRLLGARKDLALRKINVVSWSSPVARRHLAKVPTLPYVVVYGRDRRPVRAISGVDLAALDRAIAEGARR